MSKNTTLWSGICLAVLFIVVAGFVGSCGDKSEIAQITGKDAEENALSENHFLKQNVAFADARVRSISESEYVREIVLVDFSRSGKMPSSVIFHGTTFFDDGSYNDMKENDGIYASAAVFSHSESLPYEKDVIVKSVMEQVVIDSEFQYRDRIEHMANVYSKPGNSKGIARVGGEIGITCDIEFNTCGCRADRWGWCNCCCFTISNCKTVIAVKF